MLMAPMGCAVFGLDLKTVLRLDRETMTKLSGLITGVAKALRVPERSVNTVAANLRKHKLITTGPRGPGAPEMTPTDLTNLVLGMMFDDEFANAHIYVPRLRLAPLKASIGHWFEEKRQSTLEPPPHEFTKAGDGEPALLGDVLDCIFDWKVRYGTIDFEHKDLDAHLSDAGQVIDGEVDPTINWGEVDPKLYLYVKNFNMTVSRPLDEVLIDLDAAVVQWRLVYAHPRPDLEALADEECRRNGWPLDGMIEQEAEDGTKYKICLRPRPDSFLEPYMTSSRAISDTSLDALADVLRGAPWDEDADPEEIVAPYDQLEEVEA